MSSRILWVEDEYMDLRGLVRPLQQEGFLVDFAPDFKSACDLLNKKDKYALIIIDVIIPEGDQNNININYKPKDNLGIKLIKIIQSKSKSNNIPIIILSVVPLDIIKHYIKISNIKILTKGIMSPSELKDEVINAINNSSNN